MTYHHPAASNFPRINVAAPSQPAHLVLRASCCRCEATEDFGAAQKVLPLAVILAKLKKKGWRVHPRCRTHDLCPSCCRGAH